MARVLYLCSGRSFRLQSLNRKLAEVALCWREAGHDVVQVCGGDIPPDSGERDEAFGAPKTHNRWRRKVKGIAPLVRSASEWRDIRHDRLVLAHLEKAHGDWRPDIVWERSCRLHRGGLDFARRLGVPYVLEWKDHLVDYRHSLFRRRAMQMEEAKIRGADFIVVESGVLREKLAREGCDPARVIVAHNAVRADQFARDPGQARKARHALGVDDSTVLAGYLGSYAFYHDTERLVRAADLLQRGSQAKRVKVIMVGAGQEYQASRALADRLGLIGRGLIMRPGVAQGEVPGLLSALDIAVLPGSTDIICPIKIQEYMAAALPAVVPDYPCNREVLRDGDTGMLFKPGDESALAARIAELAQSRERRAEMGWRARAEARRRFSWEATWGAALEAVLGAVKSR